MGVRLAVALLLLASPAVAGDPSTTCCSARLRQTGLRARQIARCHARAAAKGVAADPACLAAATGLLRHAFGRLDDCPPRSDAALVSADLQRVVGDVASALRPLPGASACAARKLKALGRFAVSVARTFASHAPRPVDDLTEIDPLVIALRQRLGDTFTQIERRETCAVTNDASILSLMVTSGVGGPSAPDGILRASLRLCPACGDGVVGGVEQCDGVDAPTCPGACTVACRCPTCGDNIKNQASEACDGAQSPDCPGLCRPDCSCPTPVCGNNVKEAGEECDGTVLGLGCAACLPDCTCAAPVCGNGVVESGEECDGNTCPYQGDLMLDCSDGCQCCYEGDCYDFGCCGYGEQCFPAPTTGYCVQVGCNDAHPCGFGYTCGTNPLPPELTFGATGTICRAKLGSYCAFPGVFGLLPCEEPAICRGVCCLPAGSPCSKSADCCDGGTCTAGVCTSASQVGRL